MCSSDSAAFPADTISDVLSTSSPRLFNWVCRRVLCYALRVMNLANSCVFRFGGCCDRPLNDDCVAGCSQGVAVDRVINCCSAGVDATIGFALNGSNRVANDGVGVRRYIRSRYV